MAHLAGSIHQLLQEMEADIEEKDKRIKGFECVIEERDKRIKDLEVVIEEKSRLIEHLLKESVSKSVNVNGDHLKEHEGQPLPEEESERKESKAEDFLEETGNVDINLNDENLSKNQGQSLPEEESEREESKEKHLLEQSRDKNMNVDGDHIKENQGKPLPEEELVKKESKESFELRWKYKTIVLEKEQPNQGFGLAISGGIDCPLKLIEVSDVVPGASADGKLRTGDIIVSINGQLIEGFSHSSACIALKEAGMQVKLIIKRQTREIIKESTDKIGELQEPGNDAQGNSPIKPDAEIDNEKIASLKMEPSFKRKLAQFPNARVISFKKVGRLGIQVSGGNAVGIFIISVKKDCAAYKAGLRRKDHILMCNGKDLEDVTHEEAVIYFLSLTDGVMSFIVESQEEGYGKARNELGDNFFVRVNFDYPMKVNPKELTFLKGELFNVRDTMHQGLIGSWQAQRVLDDHLLDRGLIPNQSRAEQIALSQKMEKLDATSSDEDVQFPVYERVVLEVADFTRPVVIVGGLADLVRMKLLKEIPEKFDLPTPTSFDSENISQQVDHRESILLSCIKNVVIKNKHCLLDITEENVEIAMYAKLSPIVLLLKSTSLGELFEMRRLLVEDLWGISIDVPGFTGDPLNMEEVNHVFERAEKLEAKYWHIFTAKIDANFSTANDHVAFFNNLKETIFDQQIKSTWVPVDKSYVMPNQDTDKSTTLSTVIGSRHNGNKER